MRYMHTIEIEAETEKLLFTLAKKDSELLVDIASTLPKIPCFENQDPLTLQKAMRDEWH